MVEQVAPDVFLPSAGHKLLFFAGTARLKSQMSPPLFFLRRQCPRKLKWSLPSCPHLTRCHYNYNLVRHSHLADFSTVFFHICHVTKIIGLGQSTIFSFGNGSFIQSTHRFLQTRLNCCPCLQAVKSVGVFAERYWSNIGEKYCCKIREKYCSNICVVSIGSFVG